MAVPCVQVEKCEKCLNYYATKSVHRCMSDAVEKPRKLRKILPAECIENKASLCSLIRSLSDDDRDQKLEKEQDTDNEYNLTSCLIRAVEVRRPLFDQKISLSKRSEEIKNRLWNEIYVELQGQFTIDELKKKWKYLREKYVRERQKRKSGGKVSGKRKWLYYVQLSFLEDVTHDKRTTSNDDLNLNNNSEDSAHCLTTTRGQKRKSKYDNDFQRHLLNVHKMSRPSLATELNEEPHDSDMAFGTYLVALMKDLPIKKRKKLQCQFIASVITTQDSE